MLDYEIVNVYISHNENRSDAHSKLSSASTVPTLVLYPAEDSNDHEPLVLSQSFAALEFLEEYFPDPQLLPSEDAIYARSIVRSLVGVIATDMHPLSTYRVGREVAARLPESQAATVGASGSQDWDVCWIIKGLAIYEHAIAKAAGTFSYGDQLTMADVVLLPEPWTAERIGINLEDCPVTLRVYIALGEVKQIDQARQNPSVELVQRYNMTD